jgi:hypothetical protein
MDNMLSSFVAIVPAAIPQRLGEEVRIGRDYHPTAVKAFLHLLSPQDWSKINSKVIVNKKKKQRKMAGCNSPVN